MKITVKMLERIACQQIHIMQQFGPNNTFKKFMHRSLAMKKVRVWRISGMTAMTR
jgi:hypothetical protein